VYGTSEWTDTEVAELQGEEAPKSAAPPFSSWTDRETDGLTDIWNHRWRGLVFCDAI